MKTIRIRLIALILSLFLCGEASAFCISGDGCPQTGTGWPGATATFHSKGFIGSNSTFDNAFVMALNNWNNHSNFSYSSINASADPCDSPDSTRGWEFNSTICGSPFGGATLAITLTWANSFSPTLNNIIDSDIFFNTTFTWDVHNGSGTNIDFKRVAVHELGHALGLSHENTVPALMNPLYSQTIETPQVDDFNGLRALYGGGNLSPESMTTGDMDADGQDDVIIDFGPHGIWLRMNDSTWAKLHSLSPETMTTGDMDADGQDEVIIDFGNPYGLWLRMNNSSWVKLHNLSPESIKTGDMDGNGQDEVIIDFGNPYGLWLRMNNSSWLKLHNLSPEIMTTGDMDGNGQDELIIDFGPYGIWLRMNNSSWVKLHNLSPETMTTGDMDGNGQDELIVDFGIYGLWLRMNNSAWVKIHNLSPEIMTAGDMDADGQDEVITNFGPAGIWLRMNNSTWVKLNPPNV